MPNSNRRRGDYFERRTMAAFRAQGWLVIRSAGSYGPADLWAARSGRLLLISCKLDGKLPKREREALLDAADGAGADAVLAHRGARPGVKLPPGWVGLDLITREMVTCLAPLHMPPQRRNDAQTA